MAVLIIALVVTALAIVGSVLFSEKKTTHQQMRIMLIMLLGLMVIGIIDLMGMW